ncbi:hypothetical protein D3C87_1283510 [compost metagenome]
MTTKAEALFETAKKLMELQAVFAQQITALENDAETPKAQAHMFISEAISLASSFYEKLKEGNKLYLDEMVEKGNYTYTNTYIAGVQIEGKTYTAKPVKGYELLNKEDPKVWALVLAAAAKNNPEVIQKRITDSKVTKEFLADCQGLVAEKTSDDYTWSVTKTK